MPTALKSWNRSDISKILMIASAFAIGLLLPGRISVTVSKSLDHRIYVVSEISDPREIRKGSYVLFNLRSKLIGNGEPVNAMKIVTCVEGDVLKEEGKNFYCNGKYLVTAKDTSLKGDGLEHFSYNGRIPEGKLFVTGQHTDSYDSRYYGFIGKDDVKKIAHPIY